MGRRAHPLPDLLQRTGARRVVGAHAVTPWARLEVGVGVLEEARRRRLHAVGHGQLPVERVRRRELRVRGGYTVEDNVFLGGAEGCPVGLC